MRYKDQFTPAKMTFDEVLCWMIMLPIKVPQLERKLIKDAK